jgi:hypothetical protein
VVNILRGENLLGENRSADRKPREEKRSPAKPRSQKSMESGPWSQKSTDARRLLAGGSTEAPSVSRNVENSFRWGYYLASTNLDRLEWEVMYHQFVESVLIVKPLPASD